MNTIILKKHLQESRGELVPTQLIIAFGKNKKYVPYYGLVDIKRDKEIVIE